MRALCLFLLSLIFSSSSLLAQSINQIFTAKYDADVPGIAFSYNPATDECGENGFDIGAKYGRLVISDVNDSTVIVVVSRNDEGDNMAERNRYFCIDKETLVQFFDARKKPEIGILTVPFKLRMDPIKVMAGNTIGPYIGKNYSHNNGTSSTLLAFASLTNVPLNDINDDIPETKWGLGIGLGYVWNISGNFQTGIISGIDIFEGVEDWPYKFQPWLSLSIGFNFTSSDEAETALKLAY